MAQTSSVAQSALEIQSDSATPFIRGFLLNTINGYVPEGFTTISVLPGLSVEAKVEVEAAGSFFDKFVVIIGTCVSTEARSTSHTRAADHLLHCLAQNEAMFYEALTAYAGRYAIIYGDRNTVKVINDATAMRPVFYASAGGVVASHALLVERTLTGTIRKIEMPFRYGFPGNATPYRRTKLLTPNTEYNLTTNRVARFWPNEELPERDVEDAAREILDRAVHAIQKMAEQRPLKMALTAGLDSRTMLAVMLHSGIDFEAYTYGIGKDTLMDRNLASDLAKHLGIKHTIIENVQTSSELRARLDQAHYATHHKSTVASLAAWFGNPDTAAVTSNLLEIGRSFYQHAKKVGVEPPVDPTALKNLHYRSIPANGKTAIAEWGKEKFDFVSTELFGDFLYETQFEDASRLVDPFDLFYWEHRMSAWHGASMVERDYYAEPFIPFNALTIFKTMLGVPEEQRQSAEVFKTIIDIVDPALLALPINPKTWPLDNQYHR